MVYSTYQRQHIPYHYLQGHKAPTITKILATEGFKASQIGVAKFLDKFSGDGVHRKKDRLRSCVKNLGRDKKNKSDCH